MYVAPSKTHQSVYMTSDRETVVAWVTKGFELYATFSTLSQRRVERVERAEREPNLTSSLQAR